MIILKKYIKFFWGLLLILKFRLLRTPDILKSEIVFYFPYYHLGGAEQVHLDIVKAVQHKKCVVIFTHLSATPHFLKSFREVANIIEFNDIINKKSEKVTRLLLQSVAKAINKSKCVEKVMGCNTVYFYESLPFIKKQKLDLIHAVAPENGIQQMLANAAPYLYKRITINRKGAFDLQSIYNEYDITQEKQPHIEVISNGIDMPMFNNPISKDTKSLNVGFVGRWSEEKRPELYLQIADQFKEDHDIQWTMAGSGLKQRNTQINAAGVKNLNQINDKQELINHYKELHVILITSIYEGFPMVLMEAMAYGVIPVCTNVGGISEHINHGINGFLIDENVNNHEELMLQFVAILENLKADPNTLERISKACTIYARAHFSIDNFNLSYQRLLTRP